ncbi:MAG: restriction endonuclease subunit S [Halopseudomonas sp.]|uniref:restriction endonuclease subunit S n=1 Tax=Halopseudomonas sp. TaxID=2901191 RepID=UPI003002B1DD
MVRTQDIRGGYFDTSSAVRVDEEVYAERTKRVEPTSGDVLFSREGTYFGDAAEVPSGIRVCLGQRMVLIRPDPEKIRSSYLRMQINSAEFQSMLRQFRDGTVAERLNLPVIRSLQLKVPSLSEQDFIVKNISSIERKIELNRQINTTFEAMAQALFKSWFVDFDPVIDNALAAGNEIPAELAARAKRRAQVAQSTASEQTHTLPAAIRQQFPDRFVFTETMGWVPEGWEAVSLEDVVELIGGGTPKTTTEEYWGGDIPWFSVVDAPAKSDVFVLKTEKNITELGLSNCSTKLLPEGTTIISARGTVGKCALVGKAMAMNQSCYGIRGKSGIADYYVYYTILLRVSDLQQRGHGSVFNTITRDTFKSILTPRCPASLTAIFHTQIGDSFSRIRANNHQNDSLAHLRDTLLPKLLSGQLRIPDAQAAVDEAMAET